MLDNPHCPPFVTSSHLEHAASASRQAMAASGSGLKVMAESPGRGIEFGNAGFALCDDGIGGTAFYAP
jgi:hypothetical protein